MEKVYATYEPFVRLDGVVVCRNCGDSWSQHTMDGRCTTPQSPFCPQCGYRMDVHRPDGSCPDEWDAQAAWGRR